MKIICLVGMPGAGKGSVGRILEQAGIPSVVMSSVVREEVANRGLELNIKNLDNVAVDLREKFGRDVVAKRIAEKVRKLKSETVCVDGVRNAEEIDVLKNAGDAVIVSVTAPEKTRFERLVKRAEQRDPKNFDEFRWREQKQVSLGMNKVMEIADYTVRNDGSLAGLKKKVSEILAHIGHV